MCPGIPSKLNFAGLPIFLNVHKKPFMVPEIHFGTYPFSTQHESFLCTDNTAQQSECQRLWQRCVRRLLIACARAKRAQDFVTRIRDVCDASLLQDRKPQICFSLTRMAMRCRRLVTSCVVSICQNSAKVLACPRSTSWSNCQPPRNRS